MSDRTPIGHVIATVELPIFDGDVLWEGKCGDWFEYAEPGVTERGTLGVCRRDCKLLGQRYVECRQQEPAL